MRLLDSDGELEVLNFKFSGGCHFRYYLFLGDHYSVDWTTGLTFDLN